MNEVSKKYLLGLVAECQSELVRWDDGAWRFLVEIVEENDHTLFDLAPPELKAEIFKIINRMHADGAFISHIAHVGSFDETEKVKKFESLLMAGGHIKQ